MYQGFNSLVRGKGIPSGGPAPSTEIGRVFDREAAEGSLEFHALQTTYVTLLIATGATLKESKTLARHSTLALTTCDYGRTREKRLPEITDEIGAVLGGKSGKKDRFQ